MPRKYIGSFDEAMLTHPVTRVLIVVKRNEPTTELDDVAIEGLGPQWVECYADGTPVPPPPPPAEADAAPAALEAPADIPLDPIEGAAPTTKTKKGN